MSGRRQCQSFLNSTLERVSSQIRDPAALPWRKHPPGTHLIEGDVGLTTDMPFWDDRSLFIMPGIEPRFLVRPARRVATTLSNKL